MSPLMMTETLLSDIIIGIWNFQEDVRGLLSVRPPGMVEWSVLCTPVLAATVFKVFSGRMPHFSMIAIGRSSICAKETHQLGLLSN